MTNSSFVRYMFKHWSRPRAVIGVYMIALFYLTRLAGLASKRLLNGQVNDELFQNHWVGLKGILSYKRDLLPP